MEFADLKAWALVSRTVSFHASELLWSRILIRARKKKTLSKFLAVAAHNPRLLARIRSLTIILASSPSSEGPPLPFPSQPTEPFWTMLLEFFDRAGRLRILKLQDAMASIFGPSATVPARFFSVLASSSVASQITSLTVHQAPQDILQVLQVSSPLRTLDLGASKVSIPAPQIPLLLRDIRGSADTIAQVAKAGSVTRMRCVEFLDPWEDGEAKTTVLAAAMTANLGLDELQLKVQLDSHAEDDETISALSKLSHQHLTRLAVQVYDDSESICNNDGSDDDEDGWGLQPKLRHAPLSRFFDRGVLQQFPSLTFCRVMFGHSEFAELDLEDVDDFAAAAQKVAAYLSSPEACGDALEQLWVDCVDLDSYALGDGVPGVRIAATRQEGVWMTETQFVEVGAYADYEDLFALP